MMLIRSIVIDIVTVTSGAMDYLIVCGIPLLTFEKLYNILILCMMHGKICAEIIAGEWSLS